MRDLSMTLANFAHRSKRALGLIEVGFAINEKARLFHASAAGGNVRLANPGTDKNCNTVTVEAH